MLTQHESSMGEEMNFESISTLDEEIAKGRGDLIKLKRTRNSMLNISVLVPPEILGYIFNLVVIFSLSQMDSIFQRPELDPSTHRYGLEEGWYNFLLVCHHWLEVAYATPEVWTFWGNSLEAWEKRYIRAGSAPVDLALRRARDGHHPKMLSVPLQNNLLGRTARDTIRKIHLESHHSDLLVDIVSLLTPSGGGVRERSIESIILSASYVLPDLSNFFARSRFSKLRRLHLGGFINTPLPWNHLASQTAHLTSLSLSHLFGLPPPTSQLLSVLLSNPNLRTLLLNKSALPEDIDESEIRVPLRHLEELILWGKFSSVFRLLQRLELTVPLNYTSLQFDDYPAEEGFSRTLGPYMQDHLRRDTRFQEKLSVSWSPAGINISRVSEGIPEIDWIPQFHTHMINWDTERLFLDLKAFAPLEHVVRLDAGHCMGMREELFIAMPNVEVFTLREVSWSDGFLQPDQAGPYANAKLLPSLRLLRLKGVRADAGWRPLVDYLVHQTSNGQAISLKFEGHCSRMPPEVIKEVEDLVEELDCRGMLENDAMTSEVAGRGRV